MSGAGTYSARETGVMQGLEKHNLTRITDAPAAFLIQLQRNFIRAFLVKCSFDTHCLQNSEIPAVYGHQYCRQSKKNIYCSINNTAKEFCQNFKLYTFLVKVHQNLNFETKIVGIRQRLSEIYYFKAENTKFYDSNFEPLLSTFCTGLFSLIVCLYILNFCISRKDKNN